MLCLKFVMDMVMIVVARCAIHIAAEDLGGILAHALVIIRDGAA